MVFEKRGGGGRYRHKKGVALVLSLENAVLINRETGELLT